MRNVLCLLGLLSCTPGRVPVPDKGHDTVSDTISVDSSDSATPSTTADSAAPACAGDADPSAGLTPHFRAWLAARPRYSRDLARDDVTGGAFGGRVAEEDCALRQPVVFVHGNGDRALGGVLGGWTEPYAVFSAAGYRSAELYATTFGPADPLQASSYQHDRDSLVQVRLLLEAVLDYTGAEQIDVVAHSLGVTMARRAILGGVARDADGTSYDLGPPLSARIDTFVGIAGGNLGLASCVASSAPVCGPELGLYPGWLLLGEVEGMSEVLSTMQAQPGFEGRRRISLWSDADEVVGGACLVWGRNTCRLQSQTDERHYSTLRHMELRDTTAPEVLALVSGP